jgi:hypothetical protein
MKDINCITKLPCQDNCQAPLCPLDCHDKAIWYPEDDICYSKAISKPTWVSTQRKIQRLFKHGLIDAGECFTRALLDNLKRVGKGLHGLRPENLHKDSTG